MKRSRSSEEPTESKRSRGLDAEGPVEAAKEAEEPHEVAPEVGKDPNQANEVTNEVKDANGASEEVLEVKDANEDKKEAKDAKKAEDLKEEAQAEAEAEAKAEEKELPARKREPETKVEGKEAEKPSGFSSFSSFSAFSKGGFGFTGSSNGSTKTEDKPTESEPAKPSGFSGFGSFGSFGAGKFGAAAKESGQKTNPWAETTPEVNPWAEKSEPKTAASDAKTDEDAKTESEEDSKPQNDAFAQVTLEKQDLKTGEEDECNVHSLRVRLYAVDSEGESKAWKERGTGLLKLNQSNPADGTKFRLVMRLDGVLRVALNLPLFKDMQLSLGFNNSLHTERFVRISGIEDGEARQFAVRCSSEEARDQLYDAIETALKQL